MMNINETSDEELSGGNERDDRCVLHISNFEGSLDLLWHLIKKSKIDITEISISEITEQYINYLKLMTTMNIKIASEFVLTASELLYYKSKALLPSDDIEDEYFIPPLPADLIQKLLEFKKFQMTSKKLKENYEIYADFIPRLNENVEIADDGELVIEATLFDLIDAFAKVLKLDEKAYRKGIEFNEVLVSDRIDYISSILAEKEQILFSEIFTGIPCIGEIIASFLAILEMTKGKRIKLMQYRVYGEIVILRADACADTLSVDNIN